MQQYLQNLYLLPGLIDVHTHLREPGFIYNESANRIREGIKDGTIDIMCRKRNIS